jgi:hypothetical protein
VFRTSATFPFVYPSNSLNEFSVPKNSRSKPKVAISEVDQQEAGPSSTTTGYDRSGASRDTPASREMKKLIDAQTFSFGLQKHGAERADTAVHSASNGQPIPIRTLLLFLLSTGGIAGSCLNHHLPVCMEIELIIVAGKNLYL